MSLVVIRQLEAKRPRGDVGIIHACRDDPFPDTVGIVDANVKASGSMVQDNFEAWPAVRNARIKVEQ